MMTRTYGVVIALVSDVDDPDQQGRIKLRFPWLPSDETRSGWVPIVRPLAGHDRGFHYQPEVDDEALVAFEHGDFNHPIVLGFLHNGVDLPPNTDIDVHVRRLRSVAGHTCELDDRDGKESVRLSTAGGHQVEMRDPQGYTEIVTAGGQNIRLQDKKTPPAPEDGPPPEARIEMTTKSGTAITVHDDPSKIELKTVAGVTVTISDTEGVTVSAPTAAVSVKSLTAEVQASASATIKAPTMTLKGAMVSVDAAMANFSGIVSCQTLIAKASVVSPAYTPGIGNIK
jgi:uncharacterized protein involved in type VI secretion and phage assembly